MKRKIRLFHQIEITSKCNLKCKYCVHPTMQRPKEHMTFGDFKRSIELVKWSMITHGQRELNICGIGESTLHPNLVDFCSYARKELGNGILILLSSNGIEVDEKLADSLKPLGIMFYISMHRPEKAGPAVQVLRNRNMLLGVDANAAINATDWAGQVKWFVSSPEKNCFWIPDGRVFIDSSGYIRACCYDGDGMSVVGHIRDDNATELETENYGLCKTCHMNSNLGLIS